MIENIPGTLIPFKKSMANDSFSAISPLLTVGGLTLGQVREMTGLSASAIQNWVKRGWVKNPENKRYGEEQLMRIILINMMRGSMQMEQIAFLMGYINGSVDDRSDDILPDRELFNILCSIIYKCESHSVSDKKYLDGVIDDCIEKADISDDISKKKLKSALTAMVLAFVSTKIGAMAQQAFENL